MGNRLKQCQTLLGHADLVIVFLKHQSQIAFKGSIFHLPKLSERFPSGHERGVRFLIEEVADKVDTDAFELRGEDFESPYTNQFILSDIPDFLKEC